MRAQALGLEGKTGGTVRRFFITSKMEWNGTETEHFCYAYCTCIYTPFPVLKAVCILSVICYCYSIFVWTYNFNVCVWVHVFSVCGCMFSLCVCVNNVCVCVYIQLYTAFTAYTCTYMYFYITHTALSFLSLAVSSCTISLSFFPLC